MRRGRRARPPDKARRARQSRRRYDLHADARRRAPGRACAPGCRDSSAALWRRRKVREHRVPASKRAMAPRVSSGTPLCRPILSSSATIVVRLGKGRRHVAVAFAHDRGFGRMAGVEFAGRRIGGEEFGQRLRSRQSPDRRRLRRRKRRRQNDRDRFADIAHAVRGEDRLAVRLKPFDAREPKIDRRNFGDVRRGPDRDDARHAARGRAVSIATMRPCAWAERTTRMCN